MKIVKVNKENSYKWSNIYGVEGHRRRNITGDDT